MKLQMASSAALAALLLVGCDKHPLEQGEYRLAIPVGSTIDDRCGLTPDGGLLWNGTLASSGEVVSMAYALPGTEATNGLGLFGKYKSQVFGKPDSFTIDGTANRTTATLRDASRTEFTCSADFLQIHLEGDVGSSSQFSGTIRIAYTLSPTGTQDSRCPQNPTCELAAPVIATLVQ